MSARSFDAVMGMENKCTYVIAHRHVRTLTARRGPSGCSGLPIGFWDVVNRLWVVAAVGATRRTAHDDGQAGHVPPHHSGVVTGTFISSTAGMHIGLIGRLRRRGLII